MTRVIITLSTLFCIARAQNNSFNFFWPWFDNNPLAAASIELINPSTTIVEIACPSAAPNFNPNACDPMWSSNAEYSIISKTIYQGTRMDEGFTMSFSCNEIVTKQEVVCTMSLKDEVHHSNYMDSSVFKMSGITLNSAIVTAGAERLSGIAPSTSGVAYFGATTDPWAGIPATTTYRKYTPNYASETAVSSTTSDETTTSTSGAATTSAPVTTPESMGAAYHNGVEISILVALAGVAVMKVW